VRFKIAEQRELWHTPLNADIEITCIPLENPSPRVVASAHPGSNYKPRTDRSYPVNRVPPRRMGGFLAPPLSRSIQNPSPNCYPGLPRQGT
jgi:hypothetical protein